MAMLIYKSPCLITRGSYATRSELVETNSIEEWFKSWIDLHTGLGKLFLKSRHGDTVSPVYIGETMNLRSRLSGHLKSVPLMKAIENSPNGKRIVIFCTVAAKKLEAAKKQITIIEKALILHAQSEGYELFNKKGTKSPTDAISFTGNRTSEAIAPRVMLVKRALTRS